jgi:hypothetical protein
VFEDGETVIIRGDVVDAITLARADGEAAVRLPRARCWPPPPSGWSGHELQRRLHAVLHPLGVAA